MPIFTWHEVPVGTAAIQGAVISAPATSRIIFFTLLLTLIFVSANDVCLKATAWQFLPINAFSVVVSCSGSVAQTIFCESWLPVFRASSIAPVFQ